MSFTPLKTETNDHGVESLYVEKCSTTNGTSDVVLIENGTTKEPSIVSVVSPAASSAIISVEDSLFYAGWRVVFASFIIHVMVLGTFYSQGVLYRAILADDSLGADRASGIIFGSSAVATQLAMGVLVGWLTSRFSHRRVALLGSIFFSGGLLAASLAVNLVWLTIFFASLVGVGASLTFQPAVVIIPLWFSVRRGLASGIAVAGSGVGTLIMAQVFDAAIQAGGWRFALRVTAAFSAVLLTASSMALVKPGGPKIAMRCKCRKSGRDNVRLDDEREIVSPLPVPSSSPPIPHHHQQQHLQQPTSWRALLAEPAILPIACVMAIYAMCLFTVYAHIVPAALDVGLSEVAGAGAVSAMGIAGAAGRLLVGAFSDRVRNKARLIVVCLSSGGLAVLALGAATPSLLRARAEILATSPAAAAVGIVYTFSIVFGFFSGSIVSQMPPLVAQEVGLTALPIAMGIVYCAQAPFVITGPPLAGALRAAANSYTTLWCIVGAFMSLSPLGLMLIPSSRGP